MAYLSWPEKLWPWCVVTAKIYLGQGALNLVFLFQNSRNVEKAEYSYYKYDLDGVLVVVISL